LTKLLHNSTEKETEINIKIPNRNPNLWASNCYKNKFCIWIMAMVRSNSATM